MSRQEIVSPQEAARRGWWLMFDVVTCFVCRKKIKTKYAKAYPCAGGVQWYTHTGKCADILDKSLGKLSKLVDEM